MRQFAESFYKSKAWQHTRDAYASSVGGLCECCRSHGLINAGEIVHHKVHLTPENINDPDVTLNFDNLELLCRDCHGKKHKKIDRRYFFDKNGKIFTHD